MKQYHNPVAVDIPFPSFLYRNDYTTPLFMIYNNVVNKYVPRILSKITKYNIINWVLAWLGIRHEWLIVLLVIIL